MWTHRFRPGAQHVKHDANETPTTSPTASAALFWTAQRPTRVASALGTGWCEQLLDFRQDNDKDGVCCERGRQEVRDNEAFNNFQNRPAQNLDGPHRPRYESIPSGTRRPLDLTRKRMAWRKSTWAFWQAGAGRCCTRLKLPECCEQRPSHSSKK